METGKNIIEATKEAASNIAASATSGLEKTKAVAQEKVDKIRAHDNYEKDYAEHRKEDRIAHAELHKQEAYAQNAAAKEAVGGGAGGGGAASSGGSYSHSTTGATGQSTGGHQMSALPGHGTGAPAGGGVVEGSVKATPIGRGTGIGTARSTTAQNPRAGSGTDTGLTGPGYTG